MTLSVEASPAVLARPEAAASARWVTVEQLADDALAQVAAADAEVLDVVRDTVAEHRENPRPARCDVNPNLVDKAAVLGWHLVENRPSGAQA